MLVVIISLLLSTAQSADKYAVAVLSMKTGSTLASAVLIHSQAALTAAHAVGETGTLVPMRCAGGSVVHGVVTRRTQLLDLALVEFEGECDSRVATVADADPIVGTALTISGFPGGAYLIVSTGNVASYDFIQSAVTPRYAIIMDANIFPGSSGGPILLDNGELGGIVTGRICLNDQDQPSQCYGTGTPVSLIRLFLNLQG